LNGSATRVEWLPPGARIKPRFVILRQLNRQDQRDTQTMNIGELNATARAMVAKIIKNLDNAI